MEKYLFIESRDPFESREVTQAYDLCIQLAQEGKAVTLFLVQNGVLPARQSAASAALEKAAKAGVNILADAFSLRERGIVDGRLIAAVKPAPLDVVVDQLAEGRKAIFL